MQLTIVMAQKGDLTGAELCDLPLSTALRSVAFDGITVSGIGLHLDKNRNGPYDSGDNLFGLLDGITTVPSRLILLPLG